MARGAGDPRMAAHLGARGRHWARIGVLVDMIVGQGRLRWCLLTCFVGPWLRQAANLVSQDATNGTHRGHVVLVTDTISQEPVTNLPGKDARVSLFVVPDVLHHVGGGDSGFAAPNGPGQDGACLVVARQDLAHAAMRDPQLPTDVTGSDTQLC